MGNILTNTFLCDKQTNMEYTPVTIKSFPPSCPKINVNNQCSTLYSAYLPAITVCRQRLF